MSSAAGRSRLSIGCAADAAERALRMWIATAEQCRRIDQRTTDEFGIASRVLMERAGAAVFERVLDLLPADGKLAVICGKGNNGGDGFVVARLARDGGVTVECLVAAENERSLSPSAAEQLQMALAHGLEPVFASSSLWTKRLGSLAQNDLIVDALLGTGARSEVRGPVAEAIRFINASHLPVVSVDVPSGTNTDTGEQLGESAQAAHTITFGLPKPFLFQGAGLECSGAWNVAEIGFPRQLLDEPTGACLIGEGWVRSLLPTRPKASNKGGNGSVLVVAGSHGMRGAATLAATAALRSGAGLVSVAAIPSVCDAVATHLPEVLLVPLPEEGGAIAASAVDILLGWDRKVDAAIFGPGLSQQPGVYAFLKELWPRWETPCVIDADALNAVSKGVALPTAPSVLTPHPGEMARLLGSTIPEVQADRFHTIESAVARLGTCVLLKGPYTIVGAPGQPHRVNTTGNSGMATGGMGDILTGVIATLLAQGRSHFEACCCGVHWHGLAGDICAENVGTVGYLAGEVASALPSARDRMMSTAEPN